MLLHMYRICYCFLPSCVWLFLPLFLSIITVKTCVFKTEMYKSKLIYLMPMKKKNFLVSIFLLFIFISISFYTPCTNNLKKNAFISQLLSYQQKIFLINFYRIITVKLGYNELIVAGQICSLKPGVCNNQERNSLKEIEPHQYTIIICSL